MKPPISPLEEEVARLRAENQALRRKSDEQGQLLYMIESSLDGVWDWNIVTGDDYLSPRWKNMLGYEDEELANRVESWQRLLHPDDVAVGYAAVQAHWEEGKPYEVVLRYIRKDGSIAWMLARGRAIQDENGNWVRMAGTHTDLSPLKRVEEELRESRERYWKFFQGAGVPLIEDDLSEVHARLLALQDRDGISDLRGYLVAHPREAAAIVATVRTLEINRAALALFEVEQPDELIRAGKTLWLQMSPETLAEALCALVEMRPVLRLEMEMYTLTGKPRSVMLTLTLESTSAQVMGRVGLLDITARRQAERQIRTLNTELERRVARRTAELAALNRELESFAYTVSHDLRAPLRAIDGFGHLLQKSLNDGVTPAASKHVERIRDSTRKMGQLIEDLLSLSQVVRQPMNNTGAVDLSALARDVMQSLQESEPERVSELRVEDGLRATGDPGLLRIAVTNLLENAWKYTRHREVTQIEVGREPDGVYYVRDNGAGFEMREANKLFQPFQRLHQNSEFPGTGIGLATVERVIRRHGGHIWAEGAVDVGATFYFHIGPTRG